MKHEQWWERGKCRDANPAIFDGAVTSSGRTKRAGAYRNWTAAREMCSGCPVQRQCLEYVVNMPLSAWDDQAFAAGFTPEELAKIRRRRGRVPTQEAS